MLLTVARLSKRMPFEWEVCLSASSNAAEKWHVAELRRLVLNGKVSVLAEVAPQYDGMSTADPQLQRHARGSLPRTARER